MGYAPQGVEDAVALLQGLHLPLLRKQLPDDVVMLLLIFVYDGLVALVPGRGKTAGADESVGKAADGRADQDGPVPVHCLGDDIRHPGHVGCVGD